MNGIVKGSSHRMHTNNNHNDDVFLLLLCRIAVPFAIQSFLHIPLLPASVQLTFQVASNDNDKMCVEYELES